MFEMFIILMIIPMILLGSYITKKVLLRYNLGPFKPIINGLRFFGVVVHELSHFLACLIVGVRPTGIQIRLNDEETRRTAPHGEVSVKKHDLTFLQGALIALAPLIVATWLFFLFLTTALNRDFIPLVRIFAGFFCLSLILGAAPSTVDFRNIFIYFKGDPKYSIYQVCLVFLSGILVWNLLIYYEITLPLDFIYYILLGFGYVVLKYSFMGINKLIHSITGMNKNRLQYKSLTRKHFKPSKPHKLGIKEAQW